MTEVDRLKAHIEKCEKDIEKLQKRKKEISKRIDFLYADIYESYQILDKLNKQWKTYQKQSTLI